MKNVVKYLHRTKDWGIIYWREAPVESLPQVNHNWPDLDPSLPAFPTHLLLQLVGFVDAACATNISTHRSVTGLVFCLAGGVIAYKSKLQVTVATSSTEAKFIAAIHAAKIAKYLCAVLFEFGFPQNGSTPLYKDNISAITMINKWKPTTNSCHIDIQYYVIQEWCQHGIIVMHHLPGVLNVADQATKALGWMLHSCHACRAMGHYRPS
jgi:hypothetical protein